MIGGMSGVERDVIPYGQVMGDRARLTGLNIIGMQRRGFTREEIQALRNAYQLLFQSEAAPSAIGSTRQPSASPGSRRSTISSTLSAPIRAARHLSAEGSRMADNACANTLGIVAGGGGLPRRLVEACRAAGREVFVLALEGAADPATVAERAARLVPRSAPPATRAWLCCARTRSGNWCWPAGYAGHRSPRCARIGARPRFFARVGYRALGR